MRKEFSLGAKASSLALRRTPAWEAKAVEKESSSPSSRSARRGARRGKGRVQRRRLPRRLALAVRGDDLEAPTSEYDLAVSYFLDVDGVFALTLEGMFLVEDAGVEPLNLDLAGLADYRHGDLGGEREHAVGLRLGRQALLRAQDGDAALAEANVLPLEANHRSAGEELAQLAGIGHVDAEAVGRAGTADLDEDLLRRLAVLARSDELDIAFVLGLDLD